MAAEITSAQLVQLAEFNLRNAKRRQIDQMEALWLCLQSVILLESASTKLGELQVNIPSRTSRLPQPSKESVHTKLVNARSELHTFLKAVITDDPVFGLDKDLTSAAVSDWLKGMLDYLGNKFRNRNSELMSVMEEERCEHIGNRLNKNVSSRRRSSEPVQVEEVAPVPASESVRDKISYQRMMWKFTTPTAAKYGINVLDPLCHKAIEDYRNANVGPLSSHTDTSTQPTSPYNGPTMRRRSTSVISERRAASRPRTLNLGNATSSMSTKISSVVSDLKSRAEKMRRRNTITSPVVSWQTAIKQHKSMISEILNDFDCEQPQDQNSNYENNGNYSSPCDVSPEQFVGSLSHHNSSYGLSRYRETVDSLQLSYQTATKTVTKQYFQNGVETFTTTQSESLDSNGNRHEIYRRGSILDNDIKVTYSRSGSLTPESGGRTPKLKRRSYSLHSFEPISPLTDVCSMPWEDRKLDVSEPVTPVVAGSVSISEDDILHTLSQSVLELANRSFQDQKYEEAQNLYEQALSILNRMYKFTGKFEPSIIPTMKQCGLIRKFRGDSLGAMGIFEQCIGVIEKRENGHCNIEYRVLIAELLFEMGNALIIDGNHSETIGQSVIAIMRDRETADFLDAPRSVSSDMDLEYSYNAFTTKGQSYPVSAFEALSCYQKAYYKIQRLRAEDSDEQEFSELSAKVLLKIGDCSILIGDLEVGTNFYESALDCFKTTETPYSLLDNAHVLVMIGFLQYISARYSKALVMLQCAMIMFHRMESNGERYEKTEFAMVKSLLCFTNYEQEKYTKAVSMGIQAKRIYEEIFEDGMESVNKAYTWLIAQTLFVVAKSYHAMRMHEHTIDVLEDLMNIFGPTSKLETILRVRVLELIGLCHEAMEQPEKALEQYNQALEVYRGQTNLGYTSSSLEHSLLSRTAGLHVSLQHYDEAAMYLDRSYASRDLEEDIRSDMVTLLHHLGETHTLASHVQSAIDCYTECVDVYLEIHGQLGPEIVKTLGKLANMQHVKAVQSHNQDKESLFEAEKFYKQAIDLDFSPVLALRYANFLFHQYSYYEAIYILQQLLATEMELREVTFAGVEQILVPVLLQSECDDDELVIGGKLLIQYLLVQSFSAIGKLRSAEYYILAMINECDENDTLVLSVIGYSLLELRLYSEAYAWFDLADKNSSYPASTIAWENKLFCVALELFRTLRRGLLFMYEFKHGVGTFPSMLPFIP